MSTSQQPCLICSTCEWLCNIKWKSAGTRRKQKEWESDDTSELRHMALGKNHWRSEREFKHLVDSQPCAMPCMSRQDNLWWRWFQKVPPLPWKVRKLITKRSQSFTNESKIAAIEALVLNIRCVVLHVILHSDCLFGLHNYWFVLFVQRIMHRIWRLMIKSYTWTGIFLLFALQR